MNEINVSGLLKRTQFMQNCVTVFLVLIVVAAMMGAVFGIRDATAFSGFLTEQYGYQDVSLRLWQMIGLSVLAGLSVALWLTVFWLARRVFAFLGNAEILPAAGIAKSISWLLWGIVVLSLLGHSISILIITAHFPSGEKVLSISVGSGVGRVPGIL